jgi:ankyrin repeat protein
VYPNPQDAFPLPPRPSLEQYKKQAKDLVKAFKAGEVKPSGAFEDFASRKLSEKCTLANAQFVIARVHGFTSWPKFAQHIESVARPASAISNFEAAADAIVNGDAKTLERLLREHPDLARARSTREHRATLLHYVSANGVENYRQKTPKNIVAIARLLLDAGADVNAVADVYGGGAPALNLTATSVHPERAGVQNALLDFLLESGARIDERDVAACLANGRPAAAEFLSGRGAPLSFEEAAGVGRLDLIRGWAATADQIKSGFLWACEYGRDFVVEYLLDERLVDLDVYDSNKQTALHHAVMGAQLGTVNLLLKRGAPLEAKNVYEGTVLGQAQWCAENNDNGAAYAPIIAALVAAGAKPVSAKRSRGGRAKS